MWAKAPISYNLGLIVIPPPLHVKVHPYPKSLQHGVLRKFSSNWNINSFIHILKAFSLQPFFIQKGGKNPPLTGLIAVIQYFSNDWFIGLFFSYAYTILVFIRCIQTWFSLVKSQTFPSPNNDSKHANLSSPSPLPSCFLGFPGRKGGGGGGGRGFILLRSKRSFSFSLFFWGNFFFISKFQKSYAINPKGWMCIFLK